MPELPLHDQLIDAVVAGLTGKDKQKITPKLKGLKGPARVAFMDSVLTGALSTGFGNFTPEELLVVTGLATSALDRLTSIGTTELPASQVRVQWVVDLSGARNALQELPDPRAKSFVGYLDSLGERAHAQVVAVTKGHGQVDTGVRKAMGGAQKLIVECLRGFVS